MGPGIILEKIKNLENGRRTGEIISNLDMKDYRHDGLRFITGAGSNKVHNSERSQLCVQFPGQSVLT